MKPAEIYILNQEEPYKSILMHIQILIEHTLPEIELKYKWKIPCYYNNNKHICYLNKSKDYVDVGFWHSAHLTKYDEYLVTENRKIVKSLRYKTLSDINDAIFIRILKEVYLYKDKSFWKKD